MAVQVKFMGVATSVVMVLAGGSIITGVLGGWTLSVGCQS